MRVHSAEGANVCFTTNLSARNDFNEIRSQPPCSELKVAYHMQESAVACPHGASALTGRYYHFNAIFSNALVAYNFATLIVIFLANDTKLCSNQFAALLVHCLCGARTLRLSGKNNPLRTVLPPVVLLDDWSAARSGSVAHIGAVQPVEFPYEIPNQSARCLL